ncbi:carbohydrate ABC transporter membrane protein 1 (CUT1 family) [Saccharothrix saharensis]|uniref:Carbohydrate ABC transporter membrane protein 1 (CUT1 family) n=1 Tax=Saccharothrix saharensis TaxID=571190 RepID=A0A543J6B8_9PSEU|nr:sugar ABC transporter permease [Saccharothrix saharensis]TQM78328.1 carbohydrate ABC transporter membrane protein 1 (CUT1 family) [Saccharothrix saharensis]
MATATRTRPHAPSRPTTPPGRRRKTIGSARRRLGLLYASPMALLVVVLFVIPLVLMVWMSFNHWPLLGASAPNGVENYSALQDPLFLRAIGFTLKYTAVTTVVLGLVAFGLALLVQESRPGVGVYRTALFLPSVVGLASTSLLFYGLFNTEASPLNELVRFLGLGAVDWLGSTDNALASTVGMITWRFAGFYMLILMTGLQSIDPLLYEAARADGANRWQVLWRVTLPLLRPTLALTMVLSLTGSLLAFDQFFILTGGRHETATVVISVYREAFLSQDLGRAAAVSVAILAVLIVVNGAQLRLLRRGR